MGPAKLQKATKLSIKMLSEEEFEALIASAPIPTSQPVPEVEPAPDPTPAQPAMPVQGELF
jgi:BRCT domain type II-containing protein